MANETTDNPPKIKTPLTESELFAIWQQDEYWGQGGSFDCDPFTGKRTPKED